MPKKRIANRKLKRAIPPPPPRRKWSDLPLDILALIIGHLCYLHQVRFRAVCKNWRLVRAEKPTDKLPWVLQLGLSCWHYYKPITLYDPNTRLTFELDHVIKRSNMWEYGGLQVCAAGKNGWLLVAAVSTTFYRSRCYLYLYNPFHDSKKINLPRLDGDKVRATFTSSTSDPTSEDCLFFAVHIKDKEREGQKDVINISTCRHGVKEWTCHFSLPVVKEDVVGVFSVKGIFYCVFKSGSLRSYDPGTRKWYLLITQEKIDSLQLPVYANPSLMANVVESNGEVLLVYSLQGYRPWQIFRLDWLELTWVKEVSLGKRVLFIGEMSLVYSASGETKDLADRVYYHSLVDSNFHQIGSDSCYLGDVHSLKGKLCKHYPARDGSMLRAWVEPPTE